MAETDILDITLLDTNQNDRTTTVNDALQAIEQATQRTLGVDLTSGNETLSEAQYTRYVRFNCTGHGASTRTLTVPLTINGTTTEGRLYAVTNGGTGTVTVQGTSGATVDVDGGVSAIIFNDGTDQILMASTGGGVSALNDLSDVTITSASGLQHLVFDDTYSLWENENIPYVIQMHIPQTVVDNELIVSLSFERDVDFAANLPGSTGYANTAPADADQWLIRKNGSNIGTVNFTGSSNAVTFTFSSLVSFTTDDRLELVADYPSDDTLAGVNITLRGTRKS